MEDAEADMEDTDYDEVDDELLEVVADIVGWTDAKKCITEGDIIACLTTIVGLSPWGKGLKLIKNTGKIIKLWNRFRKAKKARETAEKALGKALGKARSRLDNAKKRCKVAGRNGCAFTATPIVLGSGAEILVEDIDAPAPDPLVDREESARI